MDCGTARRGEAHRVRGHACALSGRIAPGLRRCPGATAHCRCAHAAMIRTQRTLHVVRAVLFGAGTIWSVVTSALAHESRPAYLEITETAPQRYSVLWR